VISNPFKMKSNIRIHIKELVILGLMLIQMSSCKKEGPITVTDIDGNTYVTVTIGNQVWMAENLKTTKLNDKSSITLVTSTSTWTSTTRPAYCWYNNDTTYKALYGGLYNWFAVATGKLCPSGWHVPSHVEFKAMEKSLGMTQAEADSMGWRGTDQGKKLKNRTGWDNNGNGTNVSGFSALAGGYRYGVTGAFFDLGKLSYWWTSTKNSSNLGLYRRLDYNQIKVYAEGVKLQAGKYVRCIKDSI
jgi:uncharacterized protein (TIGR02145 family)